MKERRHKTYVMSVGALATGLLALWLFYHLNTERSSESDSHDNSTQSPAESDQYVASVSDKNSDLLQEEPLADIDTNLPEIGIETDIEEVFQAAKEEAFAERQRQLAVEVSQESTPEKVRNLLHKTYWVGDPLMEDDFVAAERYIATLQDHPRVKSLLEVATHGSESDKQELLDSLVKMCHVYLEELPLLGDPNAPWQPTARWPGGGKAFPYLLTYVDEDASTLGLLVGMYLKMQKAYKQYHEVESDDWFSSKEGLVFGYACDHFLNAYSGRLDLQKGLSARQLEVLKEYAHHRKSRAEDWNLELRQCVVMEFAVDFVEAERKGGDAEMR